MFNLFKLHEPLEDYFPESWVCFQGQELKNTVKTIVSDILNSDIKKSHYSLCKKIGFKIGMCNNAVWNYLRHKRNVPIPIIIELINEWQFTLKKEKDEVEKLKTNILENLETLRVNNSASKDVFPIKKLSSDLSYFMGAHAADGMISVHVTFSHKDEDFLLKFKDDLSKKLDTSIKSKIYYDKHKKSYNFGITVDDLLNGKINHIISNHQLIKKRKIRVKREFRWKLVDGQFLPVDGLRKIIYDNFGLDLKLITAKNKKYFSLETKNKILARYLHLFFGFPYGKKSRIVQEPSKIRHSQINNRVAFLRGVFTFDGGVNVDGTIGLQIYSPFIFKSAQEILSLLSIDFNTSKSARKSFNIQKKGIDKKWLLLFKENTEKWHKLKAFRSETHTKKVSNENEFNMKISEIYPSNAQTKISVKKTMQLSKKLNNFDLKDYVKHVIQKEGINITLGTALAYLELLTRCNVLIKEKEKIFFIRKKGKQKNTNGAVMKRVFTYNPTIENWRLPY